MNVLICRPQEDAEELIGLIASESIKALALPTIAIQNIAVKVDLSAFTDYIFTSKHSVKSVFAQYEPNLLDGKNIYSIGASTAKALDGLGISSQRPDKQNSRELFRLMEKSLFVDKKFAIVSGVGGNTYLEDAISKHTEVTKITVYERIFVGQERLQSIYRKEYGAIQPDLIIATSIDVFKSLIRIFEKISLPTQAKVTITSPKMLKFVLDNGFDHVLKLKQIDNNYISKQILESL